LTYLLTTLPNQRVLRIAIFTLKNVPDARHQGASSGAYFFRYVSNAATQVTPQMGVFQREYLTRNPNTRKSTSRTLPHTASARRSQGMRPSGAHQRHYLKALK